MKTGILTQVSVVQKFLLLLYNTQCNLQGALLSTQNVTPDNIFSFLSIPSLKLEWVFFLFEGCRRDTNTPKIGRIQTKIGEIFKITYMFNGTKRARNREVTKFGCQNGLNVYNK